MRIIVENWPSHMASRAALRYTRLVSHSLQGLRSSSTETMPPTLPEVYFGTMTFGWSQVGWAGWGPSALSGGVKANQW